MRIFVIADASKRKAKPAGLLVWDSEQGGEGQFMLELSSEFEADNLPLSLSFCANRESGRATPEESEAWVRSRIVPENRQNIAEVLERNGLTEYDEVSLLAACKGRSSDDDLLVYEVSVPDELVRGLLEGRMRADRVLSAIKRRRSGPEVHYAFVELPSEHDEPLDSARVAGALIRAERQARGLTQTQLATRAGITQTVLSRIESGRGNPTLDLLDTIASALGMHLTVSLDNL